MLMDSSQSVGNSKHLDGIGDKVSNDASPNAA